MISAGKVQYVLHQPQAQVKIHHYQRCRWEDCKE